MTIEVTHDGKFGRWSFSFKRNVLVAVGLIFISTGLSILAHPWWQLFLVPFLGKAGIKVQESYQWPIGAVMVLIGLGFVLYKFLVVDVRDANISADRGTLSSAPVQIDALMIYFNSLTNNHSYKSSLDTAFQSSYTHYLRSENAFKLGALARAYKGYSLSAEKLHNFCTVNFFVFPDIPTPDGDYNYCLAPELNFDRGMSVYDREKTQQYEALAKHLAVLISEVQISFDGFLKVLEKHGLCNPALTTGSS
jgi:hypothetical protein